ncbi:peptidase [Nemania sp. FL0031]|nr:peptidase [Nemania sp. FL0031]
MAILSEVTALPVARLEIQDAFSTLTKRERLQIYYSTKAALGCSRIALKQVSPESPIVSDIIVELGRACGCNWTHLARAVGIDTQSIQQFLLYAARIINSIGNYEDSLQPTYVIRIASEAKAPPADKLERFSPLEYQNGAMIEFSFGDYAQDMAEIRRFLQRATQFAEEGTSSKQLQLLADFFRSGDIQADVKASAAWVKSTQTVEANFGFLSGYRDPAGVRRSMEAIVAIRDQTKVRALNSLIGIAEDLLASMPWVAAKDEHGEGRFGAFELPHYVQPEFMSLNLLSLTAHQCWYAMIGPTYQDIRDNVGKKNLYFENCVAATTAKEFPFLDTEDLAVFLAQYNDCNAAMIFTHELIGHGCGKILSETAASAYNFDIDNLPRNTLTGKPISCWYKLGQTPKSVFGGLYSTLSECIAEVMALFLLPRKDIWTALEIAKDPTDSDIETLEYVGYLWMIQQALRSMQKYDAVKQKWGQAHGRARFVILKTLYEHGQGLLRIEHRHHTTESPARLTIHLDKSLIPTNGRATVARLLHRLHIYKCTGDAENGIPDLESLTSVTGEYLLWHQVVCNRAQQPFLIVQANVLPVDESGNQIRSTESGALADVEVADVILRQYEPTVEGLVKSWVERGIGYEVTPI